MPKRSVAVVVLVVSAMGCAGAQPVAPRAVAPARTAASSAPAQPPAPSCKGRPVGAEALVPPAHHAPEAPSGAPRARAELGRVEVGAIHGRVQKPQTIVEVAWSPACARAAIAAARGDPAAASLARGLAEEDPEKAMVEFGHARDAAAPGSPLWGWSRFLFARAHDEAGSLEAARAEVLASTESLGWATAGELVQIAGWLLALDEPMGLTAYALARTSDPSLAMPALHGEMMGTMRYEMWRELREVSLMALAHPEIADEATVALAIALDHEPGEARAAVAREPRDRTRAAANDAADRAMDRFDFAAARALSEAVLVSAPDTREAGFAIARIAIVDEIAKTGRASPGDAHAPTTRERVTAAASACLATTDTQGEEVDLAVDARDDGATAAAKLLGKGAEAFARCLEREAPRYFAGAREGAHAVIAAR